MNIGNYAVYFWLLPVAFQIILPLVMLCGWAIFRLGALLFGLKASRSIIEPALFTPN